MYSFFGADNLFIQNDTFGSEITSDIQTWRMTNANEFGNGTNYSPATHANYEPSDTPSAVDPQMGTCYLWAPDGSAAKTNRWGANILYRYKNGVLTNVPLWNPTTGEFPHGALVAGVNDVAGKSLFDVHKRLNVNTNGCSFPANYGAGARMWMHQARPGSSYLLEPTNSRVRRLLFVSRFLSPHINLVALAIVPYTCTF